MRRVPLVIAWPLATVAIALLPARAIEAAPPDAPPPTVSGTLAADLPASGLAISANGQTVFAIDDARGAIVALDVAQPLRRRDVVAASPVGEPRPLAVGAVPGGLLVAVCRAGDAWEVRTYRPGPGAAASGPLQRLPLGEAAGDAGRVSVVAGTARSWLAITGLPAPLPPVLRAVVAGATIRFLADDAPRREGATRPGAATVSPDDALVVFESAGDGPAAVTFLDPAGRTLLELDAGVADVRAAAFSRRDGSLWVLTGTAGGQPAGLWRLDAVMRDGRQGVRPEWAASFADPVAIAGASDDTLVVAAGNPVRLVTVDVRHEENP